MANLKQKNRLPLHAVRSESNKSAFLQDIVDLNFGVLPGEASGKLTSKKVKN